VGPAAIVMEVSTPLLIYERPRLKDSSANGNSGRISGGWQISMALLYYIKGGEVIPLSRANLASVSPLTIPFDLHTDGEFFYYLSGPFNYPVYFK